MSTMIKCGITGEMTASYKRLKLIGRPDVIVDSGVYALLLLGYVPSHIVRMHNNLKQRLEAEGQNFFEK